eukprot:6200621-Pleurochrysis_carterae.AAC.2
MCVVNTKTTGLVGDSTDDKVRCQGDRTEATGRCSSRSSSADHPFAERILPRNSLTSGGSIVRMISLKAFPNKRPWVSQSPEGRTASLVVP